MRYDLSHRYSSYEIEKNPKISWPIMLTLDSVFQEFTTVLLTSQEAIDLAMRLVDAADSGQPMRRSEPVEAEEQPKESLLPGCLDAGVWADEFLKKLPAHPGLPYDRKTMLCWFASAIMAGFDEASRRHDERVREAEGKARLAAEKEEWANRQINNLTQENIKLLLRIDELRAELQEVAVLRAELQREQSIRQEVAMIAQRLVDYGPAIMK